MAESRGPRQAIFGQIGARFRSTPGWVPFVAISAFCFVVFNANFRELGLADTIPATLLPASLLRHGDFELDDFDSLLDERSVDGTSTLRRQIAWTTAIRRIHGKLRSSYPVGAALLAVPVYAVPVAFGWLHTFRDYRIAGKVAASLLVALSAGFVFLVLTRFTGRAPALFLTATYAFGTTAWTVASQALWQHGPALFCLSLALWSALRLDEHEKTLDACLVSAASAMTIVCRPQDAIAAVAVGSYALVRHRRSWLPLLGPGLALLSWQLAYNVHVFGDLAGGYPALYRSPAHGWRHLDASTVLTLPLSKGLPDILVSPSRGLFVYSPVLVVALVALVLAAAKGRFPLAWYLLFWVVGSLLLFGKNRLWWGGTSFGPRYLTELSIPLVVGLGMLWSSVAARPWLRNVVIAAASAGILIEAIGAFTWECGWSTSPVWLDMKPERAWDFRDPEILRCTELLLKTGPKRPEFGPFAR